MGIETMFLYKHNHWANQMERATTDDEMLEVAGRFSGVATDAFCDAATQIEGANLRKLLKIIDGHAQRMVMKSNGVAPGYRLSDDWIRIIFAQLTLQGSIDTGEDEGGDKTVHKSEAIEKITVLWKSLGWNPEASLNPTYSEVNTVYPVKYSRGEGRDEGRFNLTLVPTGEFPIGSVWKARSGSEWEVNAIFEDSVVMQDQEPPYRLIPFGKQQVRNWERLV